MTRVTNFGRKRTYLEAGLDSTTDDLIALNEVANKPDAVGQGPIDTAGADGEPPKKKKRIRKKKPKTASAQSTSATEGDKEGATEGAGGENGVEGKAKEISGPSKKALKKKKWKEMEKQKRQRRLTPSELRRQKRIDARMAETTCFACREKGHAAKDCPKAQGEGVDGKPGTGKGKNVMGICYRCGSTRHTLSRCNKIVDESNPLPFASCFVCNGKGHLASTCPQNKERGIYPNGGCCKLCGEKTHLAKDCDLRKKENVDTIVFMGTGERPGADEDDFHTFKRRGQEVETETKSEDVRRKMLQLKAGAQSGTVKSFGSAPQPVKKVVHF
ncbi:hypothetical protein D9756_003578 [Leucocoprinus leucothites]|uniref:CCHC-type domain-containing protein n=1 Tax=Leucocoprinus leucothites TaxID=201217 RepID=A0A8H5G7L7_9AGAR|nr:hypothetical protein D9756_003578 [Leucoagaricus leucothites]